MERYEYLQRHEMSSASKATADGVVRSVSGVN